MSRQNNNNNDAIRWSTNWLRWEERWWCDGKKTKEMPNVKKTLTIYCVHLLLLLYFFYCCTLLSVRWENTFLLRNKKEVEDAMK